MKTIKQSGFTLIELMIVVAIITILTSIAIPNYQSYVMRGKRSDAKAALLTMQQAQEKYRANCAQYADGIGATRTCVAGSTTAGDHNLVGSTTSPDGYYTLALSNVTSTTYTITATATGDQALDTDCATFSIDQDNNKTATSSNCW